MPRNAPLSCPTIRPAFHTDLPEVKALLKTTWHDTYTPFLGSERVEEMTESWHALDVLAGQIERQATSFLVADLDGMLVGHAFARETGADVLLLSRLYVLPGQQRSGVGQALLEAVMARHPTVTRVQLVVEARNTKAVAFYQRNGFVVTGEVEEEGSELHTMERSSMLIDDRRGL